MYFSLKLRDRQLANEVERSSGRRSSAAWIASRAPLPWATTVMVGISNTESHVAGVPPEFEHTKRRADRARPAYHLRSMHHENGCGARAADARMTAPRDEIEQARTMSCEAARRRITELEAELQRARGRARPMSRAAPRRGSPSAVVRKVRRSYRPSRAGSRPCTRRPRARSMLVDHGPAAVAGLIRRDRELAPRDRRCRHRCRAPATVPAVACTAHADCDRGIARMRRDAAAFEHPPVISLVMPVHDPERAWLEAAVDSVLSQAYPHLELCIADDASTHAVRS